MRKKEISLWQKLRRLGVCLRYDVKEGILRMLPMYLLSIALIGILAVDAKVHYEGMSPGVLDLSVYVFQGMEEYVYVENGPPFEIPMAYLVIGICPLLLACYYPYREWKNRGNIYILRYQSKSIWWMSKVIWCALQQVLLFVLLFVELWFIGVLCGNSGISLSVENYFAGAMTSTKVSTLLLHIYVLGMCTAIALNQIQITLQMLLAPAASFVCMIGVLTFSAYYFTQRLPGNFYMLLRSQIFREDGIAFETAMLVNLIIWLVAVVFGMTMLRRKDLL